MEVTLKIWLVLVMFQAASAKFPDFRILFDSSRDFSKDDLRTRLETMTEAIVNLEERIRILEPLEQKVRDLETLVKQKEREMAGLEKQATQKCESPVLPTGQIDEQKQGLYPTETEEKLPPIANLRHTESMDKVLSNRGVRQTTSIAFSVVLSQRLTHLGDNQVIKFDTVLLNEGNGYQPFTGAFTAPRAGIYLFLYHFGHHGMGETWLQLVKNGHGYNSVGVESLTATHNLQGGNSAVLRLSQGDVVWIQTFKLNDVSIEGEYISSFSGALLS